MDNEVVSVKNYFSSNGLRLSNEWLESCLEWCYEQNQGVNFTTQDLHALVYEQWLSLDLRDVTVPILPPNLAQQIKTTLSETYYLQMMYVIDISKPKFSQLIKLRKNNSFRVSDLEKEEINSSRVLQLTLTDGVQEIQAIELKPIASLHLNLTPGVKLQIVGPVTVRRGQIFLEEKNVVVLGGEVEDLVIQNAAENVMARALRLPENLNPNRINENIDNTNMSTQNLSTYSGVENRSNLSQTNRINNPMVNNRINENINNTNVSTQNLPTYSRVENKSNPSQINRMNNPMVNTISSQNRHNSLNNVQKLQQSNTNAYTSATNNYNLSKEEELYLSEVEMLLNTERSIQNKTHNSSAIIRNPDENKPNTSSLVGNKKRTNENFNQSKKTAFEDDDDDDLFENIDIDAHLDFIDSKQEQQEITPINEIACKKDTVSKFTVRAKFKAVLEKLTIMDNKWYIKLSISDDTGDLVVCTHNDFMTKLAGLSATEMKDLVSNAENGTQEIKNKINTVLFNLKEGISALEGDMMIEYKENDKIPFLVDIH